MKNKRQLAFSNEEPATLSKLEYFTAMAMQGLCANSNNDIINAMSITVIANEAVNIAKTTLEALEKEVNNG